MPFQYQIDCVPEYDSDVSRTDTYNPKLLINYKYRLSDRVMLFHVGDTLVFFFKFTFLFSHTHVRDLYPRATSFVFLGFSRQTAWQEGKGIQAKVVSVCASVSEVLTFTSDVLFGIAHTIAGTK